ncbi:MAG: type VI secretion system protein TssA [Candidatus Bipolaricaulia bacterium]
MTDAFGDVPVDVEPLLDPISPENPGGESLRYEGTYDEVKEARHADDPSLPQGIYERELDTADWDEVERLCVEALETRTKDLQLAAWLLEAWIEKYGFGGCAAGLDLMAGLVEGFWDDLYPPIKDGDVEFRLGPIKWIDEKLSPTLKTVPITQPDVSGESEAYSLLEWEQADHEDEADEEEASRNDILTSVTLTPTSYYRSLVEGMDGLLDDSQHLERLLSERCGSEAAVGLDTWKDTLRDIRGFGRDVLSEREPAEEAVEEEDDGSDEPVWMPEDADEPVEASSVNIRSRAEAYRLLWEAAEFLLRTEPHSPTPYLVKRAVSWGNMSLDELLKELVQSGDDLQEIYELLGMDDTPNEEDSE